MMNLRSFFSRPGSSIELLQVQPQNKLPQKKSLRLSTWVFGSSRPTLARLHAVPEVSAPNRCQLELGFCLWSEHNSNSESRGDNRHHLTQGHVEPLDHRNRMVLLTMTPFIVGAINRCKEVGIELHQQSQASSEAEPSLQEPAIGKPISHGQIIQLWKLLKDHDAQSYTLENLLWGARVYVPPAPAKPEPVRPFLSCRSSLNNFMLTSHCLSSQTSTKP